SNYGNMTFDAKAYPDPKAMSDKIHDLGFDFGRQDRGTAAAESIHHIRRRQFWQSRSVRHR
ncbi:hypothetical protein, partial [Streptomyces sp. NPDC007070]|uniref:hypothetical protein n=1 Tax=Streptomyces sp. NPDC007070 TaxID=3154312 RepID=UPI0033EBBE74